MTLKEGDLVSDVYGVSEVECLTVAGSISLSKSFCTSSKGVGSFGGVSMQPSPQEQLIQLSTKDRRVCSKQYLVFDCRDLQAS